MFQREKKAGFPFILLRLFDPEGLGAGTRRIKSVSALVSPDRQMFSREKKGGFSLTGSVFDYKFKNYRPKGVRNHLHSFFIDLPVFLLVNLFNW
ncbi:hypothetical protein ACQCVP_12400 [Rossellomorea vietnamensis]|uniref:hypothetical protein n=1 Tax=Rossellomorea vietnamensis TaxID=218284 RepID=UPI003CE8E107